MIKYVKVLMLKSIMSVSLLCSFLGCDERANISDKKSTATNRSSTDQMIDEGFENYWYSGKAELNRYKLKQARYGEIHEGDAVLIFVTEDFLTESQVKYEGGNADEDIATVLKLNFTKKFNTGIYPYSMMSSVFTAIDEQQNTFKVTTSNQEWCGHTFTQLNHRNNGYSAQLYSYFMTEGDRSISIDDVLLEDEIWNMIRLSPGNLPTGSITLLPGTQFLRLKHRELKPEIAIATLNTKKSDSLGTAVNVYKIEYKDFARVLEITFQSSFPYSILSWVEISDAGFGAEGSLTTTAVRTHVINEPYWQQNSVADSIMRPKLGLE